MHLRVVRKTRTDATKSQNNMKSKPGKIFHTYIQNAQYVQYVLFVQYCMHTPPTVPKLVYIKVHTCKFVCFGCEHWQCTVHSIHTALHTEWKNEYVHVDAMYPKFLVLYFSAEPFRMSMYLLRAAAPVKREQTTPYWIKYTPPFTALNVYMLRTLHHCRLY